METLTFQVFTYDNPVVKNLLIDLYEKYMPVEVAKNVKESILNSKGLPYLQFWSERKEGLDFVGCYNTVTHTDIPYRNYPVISIEEAIKFFSRPKFVEVQYKLNNEYTAFIKENGDVKVGCASFAAMRIIELADKIKEIRAKAINTQIEPK